VDSRFDKDFQSSKDELVEVSQLPEVEKQIQELVDLEKQQTELDSWHEGMQRQLDIEKVQLAERYDQLRLANIQKQKSIIESSHDFLVSSMNRVCLSLNNSQQSLPYEEHHYTHEFPRSHELTNSPVVRTYLPVNNSGGSSPQHSLPYEEREEQLTYEFLRDDEFQNSPLNNSASTQHSLRYESVKDKHEQTHEFPISPDIHKIDLMMKSGDNDVTNASGGDVVHLKSDQDELKKLNDLKRSIQQHSTDISKASGSELLLRHYRSVDAKLRRKSRAMKFFHTPEKSNSSPSQSPTPFSETTKQQSAFEHIKENTLGEVFKTPIRPPYLSLNINTATPIDERKKELFPDAPLHDRPSLSPHADLTNISSSSQNLNEPQTSHSSPKKHDDSSTIVGHIVTANNLATPCYGDRGIDNDKITSTPHDVVSLSPHHNLSRIYASEFHVADSKEVIQYIINLT